MNLCWWLNFFISVKNVNIHITDITPNRSMVLQNELADDDDEHFEDIVEDAENNACVTPEKPDTALEAASSREGHVANSDSDSDSLLDEGGSGNSGSEDEVSDEGDDLFVAGVPKDAQEAKVGSDHVGCDRPVSNGNVRASLPGGYDPRHREPSYWYFHLFCHISLMSEF